MALLVKFLEFKGLRTFGNPVAEGYGNVWFKNKPAPANAVFCKKLRLFIMHQKNEYTLVYFAQFAV